jgi:serine/threonine protein kinase
MIADESMIGQTLSNRYKLIGELGSGGMAWVYLAHDQVEDKTVAVKILYPQHSQDFGFVQRFIREARLSMSLSQCSEHPNIVCVLDYGADRDTHYLVMEYVPGQDLAKLLEERGCLPWQAALDIARQVALALEHAQSHEIVHRDIKPSNIMVLPDGSVRVLDLGIARARSSPELTLSGFVGSPHYAAPEQVTKGPLDIRADIYSLGVVLYRMLSGSLPFEGDTPWEVMNQQVAAPPPPLAQRRPDLPRPVVALVHKAMAKRPRDRFQSPGELVQAIDLILAGEELPPALLMESDPALELEGPYQAALAAMEGERWPEAVDHLSRVVKVDPDYRDASERLSEAGQQIRLASLYRSAQRSLEHGHWDRALAHLREIDELAPGYKDVSELESRARRRRKVPAESDAAGSPSPSPGNARGVAGLSPTSVRTRRLIATQGRFPIGRRTLAVTALVFVVAGSLLAAMLFQVRTPASSSPATPLPEATAGQGEAMAQLPAAAEGSPTATEGVALLPPSATVPSLPTSGPAGSATVEADATPPASAMPSPQTAASPEPALAGLIAFPRFDPQRGTYDVHVCAADGSSCRLVAAQGSQPDFLPDGTRLVYHSWKPDDQGLILQTTDGQRIWRISNDVEAARPSVDFEGNIYVYHSRQQPDRQPRIHRSYDDATRALNRDGGDVLGHSPTWTPDGQILYSGCLGNACGILAMAADGSRARQVVAGSEELAPEASPDGRQVAYMSRRDGNWEVYVTGLDGSDTQRLTWEPGNDGLPTWSPGGRYLAFVSDRDGSWAVWVMRADGSGQRRLFPIGGSLDGRVATAVPHQAHGWVEERISWAPEP